MNQHEDGGYCGSLAIFAILVVLLVVFSRCSRADEPPPSVETPARNLRSEARAATLTESEGAALAKPHDVVNCYQERVFHTTHICVTEAEWTRRQEKP